MIYTITFNPSLDYYARIENLKIGLVNRAESEWMAVGGKGINVSLAAKNLGAETTALGFLAGFTGKAILERMNNLDLRNDFINIAGVSRISVKIKSSTETDVNGIGPTPTPKDIAKLIRKVRSLLKPGDWFVLSGSVPKELGDNTYAEFLKKLKLTGVNVVVDATGDLLTNTLKYKPFLIKPNLQELCEIFGITKTMPTTDEITEMAIKLQRKGARNVIVSMGGMGAMMVTEDDKAMYVRAAQGEVINTVGCGDSMIAGFIYKYMETGSFFTSLNYAVATGSACAFTQSHATKEQIEYVESLML